MDFEVGDIVRVKKADECRRLATGLARQTEVFCGGTFEVGRVGDDGWLDLVDISYDGNDYGGERISDHQFRPEWLEFVQKGINNGDNVVFVGRGDSKYEPPNGTIGTVVKVGLSGNCLVQWPNGATVGDGLWLCQRRYLAKAESVSDDSQELDSFFDGL